MTKIDFNLNDEDKMKYFESLKKLYGGAYGNEKKGCEKADLKCEDTKTNTERVPGV